MNRTKKGNMRYFDIKAYLGIDAQSGLTHSLSGSAANAA